MAQFVMVLDQSVMNVSISALVEDFDTNVPAIQAVITLYSLVMAMFMLAGAVVPPESWRASLCGFPVGGRGVLVVDRAHHVR